MGTQSMLDGSETRFIEHMDANTVLQRIYSYGLFEVKTVRRSDGSQIIYFEDNNGGRYMIDHPKDFPAARRLSLLNRFLDHYKLSQH